MSAPISTSSKRSSTSASISRFAADDGVEAIGEILSSRDNRLFEFVEQLRLGAFVTPGGDRFLFGGGRAIEPK